MSAAHTPGPWCFSNGALLRVSTIKKHPLVICGVHRIGSRGGAVEGDPVANARLIAAAPELLEFAKLFEQTIEFAIGVAESAGDDEGARMKSITLNMVRAAIAKAEGRSS